MRFDPPDAYWKKDVALFFSRRFALLLKMLYPVAIIVPVAASGIPAQYAAAVVGIVAGMAGGAPGRGGAAGGEQRGRPGPGGAPPPSPPHPRLLILPLTHPPP